MRDGIDELVAKYVAAAIRHRDASVEGDPGAANLAYDVIAKTFRELRSVGSEGDSALLRLLGHEDARVRGWAAAHALEVAPKLGEPTLEQLARAGGLLGFDAEMVLAEWRRGNLRFP